MPDAQQRLHATTIALDGAAALILGPSGAGKSDLALRCLMTRWADGARSLAIHLVADDQTIVLRRQDRLLVQAPPAIAGRLEVRGMGILAMPAVDEAELRLVVDVTPGQPIERLPDPPETFELLGFRLPLLRLAALEASAPAKLVLALSRLG
jgi:serine kinase of HPr protein (carbohydrate metabolism regulator)